MSYLNNYELILQLKLADQVMPPLWFQINEEASDKVVELEQKYNVIRKPIYDKRNDIIKCIPDFWLTAVSAYHNWLSLESSYHFPSDW